MQKLPNEVTHHSKSLIFAQKFNSQNFDKTLLLLYLKFCAKIGKCYWICHTKRYQLIEFSCQNLDFDPKLKLQNIGKSQFWPISSWILEIL